LALPIAAVCPDWSLRPGCRVLMADDAFRSGFVRRRGGPGSGGGCAVAMAPDRGGCLAALLAAVAGALIARFMRIVVAPARST